MWIVRLALRRPYTVAVLAILLLLFGVLTATRMRKDIFPTIDIPVVSVVWIYPGLSTEDMERRVVTLSERAFSTTVNGISKLESQSIEGIGLVKVYFQPGTDIGAAIAQISSTAATIMPRMPPGIVPPAVLQFDASDVPVAQLTLSSDTMSEQQIFDYAFYFIRVRLFTIPGLAVPEPYGGKRLQVMVDLDLRAAAARGLAPQDVVNALLGANVLTPAGAARIGDTDYDISLNNSPLTVDQFARIPLKVAGGATVLLGDVAHVHSGFAVQTNIVRVNGQRATYLAILKKAGASTLAVVEAARDMLPLIKATAPKGLEFNVDFDQSGFVRAGINGVLREAIIAAILVALMVLAFLGSWRSVVIVSTSIPLAIAVSIIGLYLLDQSLNTMTLGGLSLAIGMLVDDATVEIENIHRNRNLGKTVLSAILDGSREIAKPAFAATAVICIVFFPVVLLTGPAHFLFSALGLSVVMAMMASYFLSRTLVPALSYKLLDSRETRHGDGLAHRINAARDRAFDRLRDSYTAMLDSALHHRAFVVLCAVLVFIVAIGLSKEIGSDFFPEVDAGQMRLHVRAPIGTRIENTEQIVAAIERRIRTVIPASEIQTINDNIGIPQPLNLSFVQTDNIGGQDADILIMLQPDHRPTKDYERAIRKALPQEFPEETFYFQPADIVTQVLDFGLAAPIDIEVEGKDLDASAAVAKQLRDKIRLIPGAVDVRIAQALTHPALLIDVDRERAAQLGVNQRDVANDMLVSLSSSTMTSPTFWLSPSNGVNYAVAVQTPISHLSSVDDLMNTPITPSTSVTSGSDNPFAVEPTVAATIADVATLTPTQTRGIINHDAVQRVINIRLNIDDRDLGGVSKDIDAAIESLGKLPPGTRINVHGQTESMRESFDGLKRGVILAATLAYLVLVVLFQSFIDPLIIMIAVPGTLIGVMLALAVTQTTLNVETLMGTIMAIGVATSNSILLVSFANEIREPDKNGDVMTALAAAKLAGRIRLRPVLMTACAMIVAMIPVAIGSSQGSEQNAAIARAVIGGLTVATAVTLFVVPIAYSVLRRSPPRSHELDRKLQEAP